ncbi:MAG: RNA polymerase sigma factor [Bacteroidota bacterium]|nr:RNA polymerase sigma factor [Bacteroidota bacterium]
MMPHTLISDEQLAVNLQHGDNQALIQIYERYKQGLYLFAYRLLGDENRAEDVVYETFSKVLLENRKLQNPASLKSWMFMIARNEAFAVINRTKKYRPLNDDDDIFSEDSPLTVIEENEQSKLLEALLNQLLPQYKEVLLLREFESMNYEEIAAITGTTIGSVKSKLFKARKELMEKAKPYIKEDAL